MSTRTLKSLVKLHRRLLDQKRQAMAVLQGKREAFVAQRTKLQEELENERRLAETSPDLQYTFGAYAHRNHLRQQEIVLHIAECDKAIETLAEAIREAFQETKTYEIMHERALDEEEKRLAKREQDELDEIGGKNYLQKREASES
ncbi:MAG: hypothetical protein K0R63_1531 [Rickettsiales bacterium]|jgi:flagellar export protein FliJ|nr:hypothetical protein [Rickettsiales bacterium]